MCARPLDSRGALNVNVLSDFGPRLSCVIRLAAFLGAL